MLAHRSTYTPRGGTPSSICRIKSGELGRSLVAFHASDPYQARVTFAWSRLAAQVTPNRLTGSLRGMCFNCLTLEMNCVTIQMNRTYDWNGSTVLYTVSLENCLPSSMVAVRTPPRGLSSRIGNHLSR